MKKIFLFIIVFLFLGYSPVFSAYPIQESLKILKSQEVVSLTNTQLIEAYIDVLTEIEAIKAFHTTSGFKPKEYQQYKDVIRYRFQLLFEIHRRKIDIPAFVR